MAEFYLDLLDSIVRNAERLYEGELCFLVHRKVSAKCLLCNIYHREGRPINEYIIVLWQLVILELQLH